MNTFDLHTSFSVMVTQRPDFGFEAHWIGNSRHPEDGGGRDA